jgi:hypothetical protein
MLVSGAFWRWEAGAVLQKNFQRGGMAHTHIIGKKLLLAVVDDFQQARECPPSMWSEESVCVRSRAYLLSRFLCLLSQESVEMNEMWRGKCLLGSVINTGISAISSCCTVSEVHICRIIPTDTMSNCYSRNQTHIRLTKGCCACCT